MITNTDQKERAELALELGRIMSELKIRVRQRIQERINQVQSPLSFKLLEIMGLLWRRDGVSQQ